jgi:hypothetical protein
MHNYLLSDFNPPQIVVRNTDKNVKTHIAKYHHQNGIFYVRSKWVGDGQENRQYSLSLDGKYEPGLNQFIKKHGLKPCV